MQCAAMNVQEGGLSHRDTGPAEKLSFWMPEAEVDTSEVGTSQMERTRKSNVYLCCICVVFYTQTWKRLRMKPWMESRS